MKSAILLAIGIALLLVGPATVAADTYTHLMFNVSPQSLPLGGTANIILSSIDNTDVPPGPSNYICTAGGILEDAHGNVLGTCSLPFVVPSPACDSTDHPFANYEVTQITVTTPHDPMAGDVYMLGTTSGAGIATVTSGIATGSPIVVTKTDQPVSVPYGPQSSPFTINGIQYEWYRIKVNGAPGGGGSIINTPTPGPTSLAGTYKIDVEGIMNCGAGSVAFTQTFWFDIGFQITTPEFGSMLMVVGLGALTVVFLKRRAVGTKIA
jgi:hypothetical protein